MDRNTPYVRDLSWRYSPRRRLTVWQIGIRVGAGLTCFLLLWGGLLAVLMS
jgi:hypothetical protein